MFENQKERTSEIKSNRILAIKNRIIDSPMLLNSQNA